MLFVDNTILRNVAECDTKATLRHVFGCTSQEESRALKAGRACHTALAAYLRTWDVGEALAAFDLEYEQWATATIEPEHRLNFSNVRRVMHRWMKTHPPNSLPFQIEPEFIEMDVQTPLAPGVTYFALVDVTARDLIDESRYVVEHKTTGQISGPWTKQWKSSSQISGQLFILNQHAKAGERVVGAFVNAIEMSQLPNSQRKCKEHGVVYAECGDMHLKAELSVTQRTPEQLTKWRSNAIALAKRHLELRAMHGLAKGVCLPEGADASLLEFVPMQGTFTGECRWCEFHDFCLSGRQPHLMKSFLLYQPWNPLDQ